MSRSIANFREDIETLFYDTDRDNQCKPVIRMILIGYFVPHHAFTAFFYAFSFSVIVIITTLFQQLFFKSSYRPPVVFHWLPIIGSTIAYGIDPFKFFFDCQAKVRELSGMLPIFENTDKVSWEVRRCFHVHSLGQKRYCLPWVKGQSADLEWKAQRCQC